jgi:hypothetical protein
MLKAKDGDFFLSDWLRNRNTVEFLGVWESIYNPAFNYGEFAIIKSQAGLNSYKLSAKEWAGRTGAPGNMRDSATLEQLVVLSNLESINAMLIHQGLQQSDRLIQLNAMAMTQMRSLVGLGSIKQLKSSQGSK